MAGEIQYNFDEPTTGSGNASVVNDIPSSGGVEYSFDGGETELQHYTDDQREATNTANNKLGFKMDAEYRWDLHQYQSLKEELSWDILLGRKTVDEVKALTQSREAEIQNKYGLNSFDAAESSPYAFYLGKYKVDVGGAIDQVFQQFDIAQETVDPRTIGGKAAIPVGALSFGLHWAQNQKLTAAGTAIGAGAGSVIPGAGTAAGAGTGAAIGETAATVKTIAETFNDVRNVAVFFDTASKEGMDFFYQAHVENGLSLEESRNAAAVVGIVNGAAETWAQDILAAPFKKAGAKLAGGLEKKAAQEAAKLVVEAMKKDAFKEGAKAFGKQFGATMASETFTEVLQEAVQIAAERETGQIDLKDPKQRQAAIDRLVQAGISAAAATLIIGGISGGMEVQNKRMEVAQQNINGPIVEKNVYARILSPGEAAIENAEAIGQKIASMSRGTGETGAQGVGSGTGGGNKTGNNDGNGTIDLPNLLGKDLNPSERHIINTRVKELQNSVKSSDREIIKAEKEYSKLKSENKSTTEVEKRIAQLHDNKDFANAEMESILGGKKDASMIASENVKKTPDKTLTMRSKQIDAEISQVNQEIKDAEKTRSIAKQGGKSTNRIVEKLAKLNERLDALNNEKALIKSGGLQTSEYYLPEAPTKGQVNLQNYRKQKVQELKANISNYVKGIAEGSKQQKVETKQIHAAVENMLREAGLRINERGEFVNTLKNIQTVEDLKRDQGKIAKKVNEVLEKRNKAEALKQLKKYTKLAKPLKGDKPVGKMTADIQKRVGHILSLANKNLFDSELAQQEIRDKALEEGRDLTPAEEQAIADLQIAGGIKERSSKDINALVKELAHLIETGRTLRQEQLQARREAREQLVKDAIESAQGNKPLPENEATPKTTLGKYKVYVAKSFVKWYRNMGGALTNNWYYRLDLMAMHDKNVALPKLLDYFPSFKTYTENADTYFTKVADKFKEVYGQKDEKGLLNKIKELSTPKDLFRYVDQEGRGVIFKGSILDALTIHLWLKNPETRYLLKKNGATTKDWMGNTQIHKGFTTRYDEDLDGQYLREKGKEDTFKYDDNSSMEAQIDGILSDQDKAFGDFLIDFLGGEYYEHVNEWYREENAADLTKTDFYFPRTTETTQDTEEKDISKFWGQKMMSVTSGAVKNRTMHSKPLKIENAYKVMANHISDMEFMIAYNNFFKNGLAVLQNIEFKRVVEGKYGVLLYKDMRKHFGEIIQRNSISVPYVEDIITFFRKNISSAYIGFNPRSALKQMLSFPIYSSEIPAKNFAAGIADFMKNPVGNAKFLYNNSALLRARDSNITIEMQEISRDPKFANFVKTGSIRDHFYILTKYGDTVNTILGGWAAYKYALSQDKTEAEAIADMERIVYKYNQTTNMEELSNMQRGSGLGKMMSLFGSDAAKQFNATVSTMRSFQRGSISKADFLRRMYILQIHLPIAMVSANLAMPSRVALLTAVAAGSTSFLPYMGEYMSVLWTSVLNNTLAGNDSDDGKEKIYLNSVGMDVMGEITKGVKELTKMADKGWYYNNWYDAYTRLGEPFVQGLLGVPSKNARKFAVDPMLNMLGIDTEELTHHNRGRKKKDSSGLADRDSGLADRDSGLADRDSGLADRDSGLADRDSGLANRE